MNFFSRKKLKHGTSISIAGNAVQISFSKIKTVKPIVYIKDAEVIIHKGESSSYSHVQLLENFLRKEAKKTITMYTDKLSKELGVSYNRIAIRDQKSRWGSCSSKKNLNFNWRLILAPIEILEYVVAHEVAHLKHMNHSKYFWDTVEQLDSNYKDSVIWLQKNGMSLHMY